MILLLNPNTSASVTQDMVNIARFAAPDLEIAGLTAPFGAKIITTPEALENGAKAVAAMVADFPKGATAAISAAFGDPGLELMRRNLSVPVAGIGEASFLEAAEGGCPWAIVTTTPLLDQAIATRVRASGMGAHYLGCRFTPGDPLALTFDPNRLRQALADAIRRAVADGAQAIVIGGGPLARVARDLAPEFSVPIIEPIPAATRLIRKRLKAASQGSAGQ